MHVVSILSDPKHSHEYLSRRIDVPVAMKPLSCRVVSTMARWWTSLHAMRVHDCGTMAVESPAGLRAGDEVVMVASKIDVMCRNSSYSR